MLPMAVPGTVLSTVKHFYAVGHRTALAALKQIDAEFELVAASVRQSFYRVFSRVTVPICLPASFAGRRRSASGI